MNRNKAKLLTLFGTFLCLFSIIAIIWDFVFLTNELSLVKLLIFIVGVVLIVLSLAYYTEK